MTDRADVEDEIVAMVGTAARTLVAAVQADSPSALPPPELAALLPPWKESSRLAHLSEMDIGPVLLEYLRTYECSLSERDNLLFIIVPREHGTDSMERGLYQDTVAEQSELITHERSIARATLDRTLLILGGLDRLTPLGADIECLKRTSLDIRNSLGLVSQAAACLPRGSVC